MRCFAANQLTRDCLFRREKDCVVFIFQIFSQIGEFGPADHQEIECSIASCHYLLVLSSLHHKVDLSELRLEAIRSHFDEGDGQVEFDVLF